MNTEPSALLDQQEALEAVRASWQHAPDVVTMEAGQPLEHHGGVPVLADRIAAYWYTQDDVYAANGVAKQWSPDLRFTPCSGVTFDTVYLAVRGKPYVPVVETAIGPRKVREFGGRLYDEGEPTEEVAP